LKFLKYWSVLVTLINWLLKPKCMLKLFLFLWRYNMIFVFRDLAVYTKTKYFFFCYVLTKTRYFNTGFVSLQYKNTNQYWSKCSEIFAENHSFFLNNFWRKFFFFFFFGLGWTQPPMWLDPTKPCTHKILRVHGTVRR
jgi:hypothetical protein